MRIGAYRLQAQLAQADARSLEDLFSPEQRTLDHWLLDVPPEACHAATAAPQTVADICSAFEPGMGNDPLAALDTEAGPAQQSPLERLIAGERP
ncbi:hypothetical protein [Pseudomonas asiatica]|uniref:hypothetical protein n=1 Tax=Pseudomonas asiatica TaxID=2219225 RepID=UPI0010C0EC7A|nr:hypothetical protein [Pseudomonas asiatica]